MVTEVRDTVRNAGLLIAQRAFHVVGAALFAVLIPRLMGPEIFGRYALLTSVSMWFALLSGLGAVSMMTRSVPRFLAAHATGEVRKLATSLLALRAGTGALTSTVYFLIAAFALGEPDLVAAAFISVAVFSRTVANLCFALFLGLNQAARWGMGELMRRWLTLVLVLVGFLLAGLRGACLGFLVANLVVLAIGLSWAWPHLSWGDIDLSRRYLSPFLRMGTYFAMGNVLISLAQRSGEALVRLATGNYAEVGFYGAAYSIYVVGAHALWQFAIAFAPLLIAMLERGQTDAVREWVERLLKWLVLLGVLGVFAVLFLGNDLVPLVLGDEFRAVSRNLVPLTFALLALSAGGIARLVAFTLDRPGIVATAAALELGTFWVLGLPLARQAGSFGASVAALGASMAYAGFITWRIRRELRYSLTIPLRAIAVGLPFLLLLLARSSGPMNVLLFLAATGGYAVLMFATRIVTIDEISAARQFLRTPHTEP
jgi:O-antigen/teichoic acid export membrane protein